MFNRFWRNTRTEKHRPDDDPLNTDPNRGNPPLPPGRSRNCICEFCGCKLTPTGEIISMGDVAKSVRKHDEVIERKDKEISRLTEELGDVKRKLEAATASSTPSSGRRVGALIE